MNPNMSNITICSFNCRSAKSCLLELHELCNRCDILLIQEHWLLPFELQSLNIIHSEFLLYGLSAVDVSLDVPIGRPYGGTAVLYRNSLADSVKIVDSNDSRITALQINTNLGPLLFLNVYMPTNYGDIHSFESYMECLGKLHALVILVVLVSQPPQSALLHRQALTLLLNRWLLCITGSSILVLKLTFSPDPFPRNLPLSLTD